MSMLSALLRPVIAVLKVLLIGFTLGVLIRNSPAAIVGYFVYSLVLPGALGTLAAFQEWFRDLQPWVDVILTAFTVAHQSMSK